MDLKKITRRGFLETGMAAAAGLHLAVKGNNLLAHPRTALETRKLKRGERFRLGILGCGNRSRSHINAVNKVEELEVAALCDLAQAKMEERKKMVQRGSPRLYTNLEKMVRQEDLDGVVVVLPNYLHKEGAVAALEAGKHVLCEKPMALNVKDCSAMIAAAEQNRKVLQIGTQRRHSTTFNIVVETIRSAPLGRILYSDINTYRGDWAVVSQDPKEDSRINWRMDHKKHGGIAYEQGAHTIDINNWIIDSEPVEICGMMGVHNLALRERTSKDFAGCMVRYADGTITNYGGVCYRYGGGMPYTYFATHGTVWFDRRQLNIEFGHPRGFPVDDSEIPESIIKDLPPRDGTDRQMAYFVKAMQGDADPYPSGYDGRRSIMISYGMEVAAQEKCTVQCSDLL